MKTLKFLLISMAILFAIAGCTGTSANEMSNLDNVNTMERSFYTEGEGSMH